jgi:MFS family permease
MTRAERTYYPVFALYNLSWSFIGPMYALFLLGRGLDLFQTSVVPAVYWIVSFVFEVPTGAFADLAGRKVAFLLSCSVRMVAFTMYAYAGGFGGFVAAEFVDALGSTLANGALDAWAVDGMRADAGGAQRPMEPFFARAQLIAQAAIIAGGLAGGYLAQRDLTLPWLVAAAVFGLTGIVAAAAMREVRPSAASAPPLWRSLTRGVCEGLRTVRGAPVLLLLCGLTLAVAFAAMPVTMYWQPRIQDLTGEGVWLMGWVWVLLNLASMAGSGVILRWFKRGARERVLGLVVLWRGGTLAVAAVATRFGPALAGLLLMQTGFGVSEPLMQAWMNEHVGPAQRATVLSVRAMCLTLGGGLGLVCIGLVARDFGIPVAWGVSAAILAVTAPGFLILAGRAGRAMGSAGPLVPAAATPKVMPPTLG